MSELSLTPSRHGWSKAKTSTLIFLIRIILMIMTILLLPIIMMSIYLVLVFIYIYIIVNNIINIINNNNNINHNNKQTQLLIWTKLWSKPFYQTYYTVQVVAWQFGSRNSDSCERNTGTTPLSQKTLMDLGQK